MPSEKLRKLESDANYAFDQYREMYFEGGVSSVYFWDLLYIENRLYIEHRVKNSIARFILNLNKVVFNKFHAMRVKSTRSLSLL